MSKRDTSKILKDDDLVLLKDNLDARINDLKDKKVKESYFEIFFHGHAIKAYDRRNGVATITTSSPKRHSLTFLKRTAR